MFLVPPRTFCGFEKKKNRDGGHPWVAGGGRTYIVNSVETVLLSFFQTAARVNPFCQHIYYKKLKSSNLRLFLTVPRMQY
jgi:hypothetical protein